MLYSSFEAKEQRRRDKAAGRDVELPKLTNAQFGEKLAELAKMHKDLMKLQAAVSELPKAGSLKFANGDVIGRRQVNSLSVQFTNELKFLKKFYTAHGAKQKTFREAKAGKGFLNPIRVTPELKAFFDAADFGYVDPGNPASGALKDQLTVGETYTTRGILTPLLNIYATLNGMQKDPENKQYLTATPLMNQYFSGVFDVLEQEKPEPSKKTGKIPDKFDRNRFTYPRIQSIVAKVTHKPDPATAKQLEEDEYVESLKQQQALVTGANDWYRAQKLAAEKGISMEEAQQRVADEKRKKATKKARQQAEARAAKAARGR